MVATSCCDFFFFFNQTAQDPLPQSRWLPTRHFLNLPRFLQHCSRPGQGSWSLRWRKPGMGGSQGLPEAGSRDKWNLLPEVVSGSCFGGVGMLRGPLCVEPPGLPPRPPAPTSAHAGKGPCSVLSGCRYTLCAICVSAEKTEAPSGEGTQPGAPLSP